MQTIINTTAKALKADNIIFLVTDIKNLNTDVLDAKELKFIRQFHKEHKKNTFSFNRLSNWVYIQFVDKERNKSIRLENYRIAGSKLLASINDNKIHQIVINDLENQPEEALAFSEGMALANYQFLKYKKDPAEKLNSLNSIDIVSKGITNQQLDALNILIDGTCKGRDLVNEPLAYLSAVKLGEEISNYGKSSGMKVEVLNKKKIESLKMGGLLAVNRGSVDPPTFSIMEWKPKNAVNEKPYIFVGKGVVFDTGGMNIKTADYMYDMKCDMAGGAAVVGAMYAISKAQLPVYVIGLVLTTDNRTDGNAYVNGDIITMHDGTQVEVINTDAEGRMILADALSYARKYKPALVIDVATLTGAAARAIGKYGIVAMQSKADNEFKKLKQSGENVCERLVEFPFWKEYEELIKSEVGDIKNIGGVEGGAITAGKFLEHFTDYPYIHLDIAGPAFINKPYKYNPTGGTGCGQAVFRFYSQQSITDYSVHYLGINDANIISLNRLFSLILQFKDY
ncbi:MAG: leucyl aminopeptidase [Bacteroidales bacterium]